MTRRLALIPARGGSVRLARKNIADFAGRPMLAWTVQAAERTELFDDIVVSTDDDEIAAIAKSAGARVLMRGADISDSAATLIQVVHDVIARWSPEFDEFCMLLANCPLREAHDIAEAHDRYCERRPPALLSVTSFGWTPPFRALSMDGGQLKGVFADWVEKKSQEYPEVVCPSGAIYWASPAAMQEAGDLYVPGLEGFEMPWHRAVDIDTREDLELALCIRHALDHGFKFGE